MAVRRELPTDELVARYRAGASLKLLAADYDVAVGTVRRRLQEGGVASRRRGAPRREVAQNELAYLQHLYGSTRAVAAELHVSRSTVQRRLQEL